jgi:hypothetical protein
MAKYTDAVCRCVGVKGRNYSLKGDRCYSPINVQLIVVLMPPECMAKAEVKNLPNLRYSVERKTKSQKNLRRYGKTIPRLL